MEALSQVHVSWLLPLSLGLVYFASLAAYRLIFHPLKHIPGSRLAAISGLYEAFYDCFKPGQYHFKVDDMHQKYGMLVPTHVASLLTTQGPVVRINPQEVHISDPSYFDELYSTSNQTLEKDPWYYRMFGLTNSIFNVRNPEIHRQRRLPITKLFAGQASTDHMENIIASNVDTMCDKLSQLQPDQEVNASNAYRRLATDNITAYLLPEPTNLLSGNMNDNFHRQARSLATISLWHRQLPFLWPIIHRLPNWLKNLVLPKGTAEHSDLHDTILSQVTPNDNNTNNGEKLSQPQAQHPLSHLPPQTLPHEALSLTLFAAETTAASLDLLTYYLSTSPKLISRLRSELTSALHSPTSTPPAKPHILPPYSTLKTLPYLTATIHEGLRLCDPVAGRLPRVVPPHMAEGLWYQDTKLPPGTVVSMDIPSTSFAESCFAAPTEFVPERWLEEGGEGVKERSLKHFVVFGRGPRRCPGQPFGMASLYMTVAALVQRFDLTLAEGCTKEDVEMKADCFWPFPAEESRGVRVHVRPREEVLA